MAIQVGYGNLSLGGCHSDACFPSVVDVSAGMCPEETSALPGEFFFWNHFQLEKFS